MGPRFRQQGPTSMKTSIRSYLVCALMCSGTFSLFAENWPEWRGPKGTGVSSENDLPLKWSTNENVRWRMDLREPGNSSPIVWGQRVFINQSVQKVKQR